MAMPIVSGVVSRWRRLRRPSEAASASSISRHTSAGRGPRSTPLIAASRETRPAGRG